MGRAESGFVDINGKFLSQAEATELISGRKTIVPGEVHVEDLKKYDKIAKSTPSAKEGTPEPQGKEIVPQGYPLLYPKVEIVAPCSGLRLWGKGSQCLEI